MIGEAFKQIKMKLQDSIGIGIGGDIISGKRVFLFSTFWTSQAGKRERFFLDAEQPNFWLSIDYKKQRFPKSDFVKQKSETNLFLLFCRVASRFNVVVIKVAL